MDKSLTLLLEAIDNPADSVRLRRLAVAACAGLRDSAKAAGLVEQFSLMVDQIAVVPGGEELIRQHLQEIALEIGRALQQQR